MSLQAELARPASPLRRFFERRLPELDSLRTDWQRALYATRTLRPPTGNDRLDVATLSRAMAYRVGFGIAVTPPTRAIAGAVALTGDIGLRADLAALFTSPSLSRSAEQNGHRTGVVDFFHQFTSFLDRHVRPVVVATPCAPLAADVEERLVRACVVLARLEAATADGVQIAGGWVSSGGQPTAAALEFTHDSGLEDLVQLARVLTSAGREQLLAHLSAAVVGPQLIEGWADADLVCDGYVLAVTTTLRPRPLRPAWLYELLTYALLDGSDELGIHGVGIYLTRQGRLITWERDQLVRQLAPTRVAWSDLQLAVLPAVQAAVGGAEELQRRWRFQP